MSSGTGDQNTRLLAHEAHTRTPRHVCLPRTSGGWQAGRPGSGSGGWQTLQEAALGRRRETKPLWRAGGSSSIIFFLSRLSSLCSSWKRVHEMMLCRSCQRPRPQRRRRRRRQAVSLRMLLPAKGAREHRSKGRDLGGAVMVDEKAQGLLDLGRLFALALGSRGMDLAHLVPGRAPGSSVGCTQAVPPGECPRLHYRLLTPCPAAY